MIKLVDDQVMGIEDVKVKFEICFRYKVEVVVCVFGMFKWVVDLCYEYGVKVISMVGSVCYAWLVIRVGIDVVVV